MMSELGVLVAVCDLDPSRSEVYAKKFGINGYSDVDEMIRSEALEIPHPRMAGRRFVLAPLADLAPGLRHPMARRSVSEMLDDAPPQTIRRVEGPALAARGERSVLGRMPRNPE